MHKHQYKVIREKDYPWYLYGVLWFRCRTCANLTAYSRGALKQMLIDGTPFMWSFRNY